MYFEIEKQAINAISDALEKFDVDVPLENFQVEDEKNFRLEFPPNPDMGDLASTIAFSLAKKLRKAPNIIASEIVEKLEIPEIFEKVEAIGPYVNFFIDYSTFSKKLLEYVGDDYGQLPEVGEKIILEHTSANPNGPLHIGHVRNSIFGDSLNRLLKLAGRDVETQYYVNDMGRQIAIIVFGITELGLKIEDQEGDKIDHKIGKLYFKANQKLNEDESLVSHVDNLIERYEGGAEPELNKIFEEVDDKVYVKVPTTYEGVKAMKILKAEGKNVTATAVYDLIQAYMALAAGADYIAPYTNRIGNLGNDPFELMAHLSNRIVEDGYDCKILAASFKGVQQVRDAFNAGSQAVTAPVSVLKAIFENPSISKAVTDFNNDWYSVYGEDKGLCDM